MDGIIKMVTDTTIAIAVIAFFMYRDLKFMNQLNTTLTTLVDTVNALKASIAHEKGDSEHDD